MDEKQFSFHVDHLISLMPQEQEYYHTKYHVFSMLRLALMDKKYIEPYCNHFVFLGSILGHDLFYKTGNKINEELSAQYYLRIAQPFFNNEELAKIKELILSTKFDSELHNEEEKILHDYDYMNFSDLSLMKIADGQIINEAKRDGYDYLTAIKGRNDFYQYLYKQITVENKPIFRSIKYKWLNPIAENNLKTILNRIPM